MEILIFLGGAIAGFVAGVLVYRNNAKKAEALLVQAQTRIKELEAKVKK